MPINYTRAYADWQTGAGGGTPITEAALDTMEAGIKAACDLADDLVDGTTPAALATDLNIASGQQGDIIHEGASGLARLAHGLTGYALVTKGHGANPEWAWKQGPFADISSTESIAAGATSSVYQAATDGFAILVHSQIPYQSTQDTFYTDNSNPPTTAYVTAAYGTGNDGVSIGIFPVKFGNYYKWATANSGGTSALYWVGFT